MDVKHCTKCGEAKPLTDFYKHKKYADGHMTWCKACMRSYSAEYRKANPQKMKDLNKEYRAKNREVIAATKKEWRKNNAVSEAERDKRRRATNPERNRKVTREWANNNPEKVAAKSVARRARSKLAQPIWLDDRQRFLIALKYKEARVLSDMTGVRHEVDHIVPLRGKTVSGLHVP